jgi:hypothetical protein
MPFVSSSGDIAQAYSKSVSALTDHISNLQAQNESAEVVEAETNLCDSALQRLQTWNAEHQAASGVLEHSLREASHLRERVLALLQNLQDLRGGLVTRTKGTELMSCEQYPPRAMRQAFPRLIPRLTSMSPKMTVHLLTL